MTIDEIYFQYVQLQPSANIRSILEIQKIINDGNESTLTADETDFYNAYKEYLNNKKSEVANAYKTAEAERVERLAQIKENISAPTFEDFELKKLDFTTSTTTQTEGSVSGCDYDTYMLEYMKECNEKLKDKKSEILQILGE